LFVYLSVSFSAIIIATKTFENFRNSDWKLQLASGDLTNMKMLIDGHCWWAHGVIDVENGELPTSPLLPVNRQWKKGGRGVRLVVCTGAAGPALTRSEARPGYTTSHARWSRRVTERHISSGFSTSTAHRHLSARHQSDGRRFVSPPTEFAIRRSPEPTDRAPVPRCRRLPRSFSKLSSSRTDTGDGGRVVIFNVMPDAELRRFCMLPTTNERLHASSQTSTCHH